MTVERGAEDTESLGQSNVGSELSKLQVERRMRRFML